VSLGQNYAKQTAGLRQPSTIMNQEYSFVFVYPVLMNQSVQSYTTLIRDFQSTTMLKELFISNALNIVSMSSKIPSPLDDDRVSAADLVGNFARSISGQQSIRRTVDMGARMDVQQRIREKSDRVRQYLQSDQRLRALNPHVDFITLDNFIDVPVVVGTKSFTIDDFSMLLILTCSIGFNRPLNNENNLKFIINRIKGMDVRQITNLVNNSIQQDTQTKSWLDRQLATRPRLRQVIGRIRPTPRRRTDPIEPEEHKYSSEQINQILKLSQTDLDQAQVFFKFMLNTTMFKNQFGVDPEGGQMSGVVSTMSPEIDRIFSTMFQEFISLSSTGATAILRSITNIIYPIPSTVRVDFISIKEQHIDSALSAAMYEHITGLVRNSFSSSISKQGSTTKGVQEKLKIVNNICQEIPDVEKHMEERFEKLTDTSSYNFVGINSDDFTNNEFKKFVTELENITSTLTSVNKQLRQTYDDLVDMSHRIFDQVEQTIRQHVKNYLHEFTDPWETNRDVDPYITYLSTNTPNFGAQYAKTDIRRRLIPTFENALVTIFMFFFLYRLQIATCQLVDVLEVEVETATHTSVTGWPNYTLVIPIEYIHFLHTIIMSREWRRMIEQPGFNPGSSPPLRDQNVKKVVEFICNRLQVPNLVVVDKRKDEIFYKFMHMRKALKGKSQTLQTFIRQHSTN